ncbi:hypothetical protein KL921_004804 [Ogataea angusta]|uniref:Large ribosomal subunit protein uL11m n=1 Tax=Pichia angusta TaxID=870730 RepID=A0AAN6DBZ9_PICAN|nr:uncharacterized protein KL928_005256 [Ogataea angusta]KAG7806407.1 hypothetical protein KL921_004804 [Ogataea angusta]KAG7815917.1 hypothetical protein KL928_005256 [Ogataea angusta]KAG7820657.1 hypothetical protein KL909_004529 [Ogataea angusta]KAG7827046.1 hypothetical protein KL920_005044 [Ogataea angusta]KAG7832583.1 hypothetical protein KL943_004920 [Ogataea angusta]
MSTKNSLIKLIVGAGQAAPTPPVGPALGSKGVKAIDFCKEFNARTAHFQPGIPIPVKVTVKPDRSFTFDIKTPTTAWLLMQAAGIEKGQPGLKKSPIKLSLKHIYEIAKIKQKDEQLKDVPLQYICKSVVETAKSIGVHIVP